MATYAITDADLDRARAIADREPYPASWAEELERAREVIAAVGDLPEPIAYQMVMRAPAGVDALAAIDALRGPGAPDYPQTDRI
jgi:hypothetical protein